MQKNDEARPRALTVEKQRLLIVLAAGGMTLSQAAARVGCSEKTVKRERKQSPLLDHLLTEARRGRLRWGSPPTAARKKRTKPAAADLLMRPTEPVGLRPANPLNVARMLRMLTQGRG